MESKCERCKGAGHSKGCIDCGKDSSVYTVEYLEFLKQARKKLFPKPITKEPSHGK